MPTTASTSSTELTDGAAAHAAPEPAGFPRHRARAVQPGRPVGFGVVLAVLAGTAAALQTRIHGELGARIDDGALTAIISFVGGLLILLAMLIGSPAMRRGALSIRAAVRNRQLPAWLLFGGLAGALTVFSQAMTAAVIGVALFSVAMVAGQTVSSLLIDRFGLGPAGIIRPTTRRLVAAAVAVIAVLVGVSGELESGASWLLLLPVSAGFGIGYQQAANGMVREAAGNAAAATLLNFTVGLLALCAGWLLSQLLTGYRWPDFPQEAWLYVGGALGVVQVLTMAAVVRWTGVLLLGLGLIFGQLAAALVLDAFTPGIELSSNVFVGAGLALLAVLLAGGPVLRRRAARALSTGEPAAANYNGGMAVESNMLEIGTQAPDFSLPTVTDGSSVSRGQFSGKPLLVVFMSRHCPYVKHIQQRFAEVANEYQDKGVGVIAISANDVSSHPEDAPEKLSEQATEVGFRFPYLFDESQDTARAYRAACTPDFFLFDADHRLVYRGRFDGSRPRNDEPVTGEDLRAALDAVLAGETIPEEDQRPSMGCSIKWREG